MSLRAVLHYLTPAWGRLSPREARRLGANLADYPIGFVGVGPLLLIVGLPERLRRHDVQAPAPLSVEEINALMRAHFG